MKRTGDAPHLYQLTERGEAEVLKAFAALGYSEEQVRNPNGTPEWLAQNNEDKMMDASVLPPAKGWTLRAQRPFTANGITYVRGSTVPLAVVENARNIEQLFSDNLTWVSPSAPVAWIIWP